ncbi:MAG: PEGA domain-containing protein [Deltaproteobacteria bacterium]|jgi:pSer/pThr/pTyr-binding forkhead associated (FHA) protein/tetratricopeptide (TPR) repeat protein|nr:PEGA domain-containing protein [Deltaproteobacteria bacterium]
MADKKLGGGTNSAISDRTLGPNDHTVIRPSEGDDEHTPSKPLYAPPYLVVVDGPRAGAHFPLNDGKNIIGRAPGNAVRLEDQSVSRQHAELEKTPSGWMIKDLGSKNGTSVNGKPVVESVVIGHKDIVKTGIYQLRLVTQEITAAEEMSLPQDAAIADRTVFVSAPPDGQTAKMENMPPEPKMEQASFPEGSGEYEAYPEGQPPKTGLLQNKRTLIMLVVLGLLVIVAGAYFANRLLFKSPKKTVSKKPAITKPATKPKPQLRPTAKEGTKPGKTPPGSDKPGDATKKPIEKKPLKSVVKKVPVFLDFASSPMSAEVTFQKEKLGKTPLRINVELEPEKTYKAEALFEMPEIKEKYEQTVDFKLEKGESVVPILFRGPIGMIKINDLPRDVEFYLEGKFSYDRFQDRSAKLTEIVLQKPIYIPYGEYFLELRRARQLGETSQTYVTDIIFRRDFSIAKESPTFMMEVSEGDLKVFPVKIKSEPPNSDVFIDGKKVGETPYEGNFPIGEHNLVLQKEGYFEHSEKLKVDINTPFVASVKLKTSLAGAHLNNAKLAMDRQMWQEAINELAEALNSKPAPSETAQANYMLGVCYLSLNDIQRAMGYFEQARENKDVRNQAMLGLVSGYAMMQRLDKALPLLVEVMLKAKDESVKREATDLFQKISPFRSVIYVYSEPQGALVTVNGKPVAQRTPVILHELPLGNYKIRVEKAGYQPTDLNMNLAVNEFNPIIVKLKPIPR